MTQLDVSDDLPGFHSACLVDVPNDRDNEGGLLLEQYGPVVVAMFDTLLV